MESNESPERSVFEQDATVAKWTADYYHPISLWLYDRAIADMLRIMDVEDGATVLDAGCGPGMHSVRVAMAGFRVCAIDFSETMLRSARRYVQDAGVQDAVEFHQKDLTQLDIPDAAFRYVFSWGVVIHIPEAEKALDELSRVIAPGGRLALYLTNKAGLDHRAKAFARFILRRPLVDLQHLPLGDLTWYEKRGGRLCVWQFDAAAVISYLEQKSFRLIKRRIGELSEVQLHMKGFLRRAILHINNLGYKCNVPPGVASGNLFIFEKNQPD